MKKPLTKSLIFHAVIALLLVASSWSLFSRHEKIPDIKPITVSLAPIGEKTNLKPAPKQEVKPPTPTPKKEPPKPEQKKPEPKKPEPKKVEPKKPEPKKETPKSDPKKVDPKKEEPKNKEEPKPEKTEKKEEKKPEKKPVKEQEETSELDSLLKDLDKNKPEATKSTPAPESDPKSQSDAPFDANSPESIAMVDYITKLIVDQIKQCWSPPAGIADGKNMVVRVNVDIAQDGTMKFAGFEGVPNQVAADAARRAILDPECNPLRNKPPIDKYYIWKEMTLNFDPKDLIY